MLKQYLIDLINSIDTNCLLVYSVCETDTKVHMRFNNDTTEYNYQNKITQIPTVDALKIVNQNILKDKEFSVSFKIGKRSTVYIDIYPNKRIFLNIHEFDINVSKWWDIKDENLIIKSFDKYINKYKGSECNEI